ncbi:MAG: Asp-tRNA(Asn)/Glu-tRNA(Gln) amidotransferase subunit GatC [Candidatus Paceibacterota bacterium]
MEIKDIEKLAELAKIELSETEKVILLKDLDGILGYVKQIESVDVPDVKENFIQKNIWREDELKIQEFSRDLIIDQFPDKQDDFVKVKKIL